MHVAQNSPRLQVLLLGRCYKITGNVLPRIIIFITRVFFLFTLYLDASVAKVAKHCVAIQVLQLNGCKQITDASLILLSSRSHSLIKLQLDAVQQISKTVLLELMKFCPFVEVSNKF